MFGVIVVVAVVVVCVEGGVKGEVAELVVVFVVFVVGCVDRCELLCEDLIWLLSVVEDVLLKLLLFVECGVV